MRSSVGVRIVARLGVFVAMCASLSAEPGAPSAAQGPAADATARIVASAQALLASEDQWRKP
jgi:hypothetical protein